MQALQVRLLRVLQSKEFGRAGGMTSVKVDVRVIAATHRDLEVMIKRNEFREDLLFRLNVFPIAIPPLEQFPRNRRFKVRSSYPRFSGRTRGQKKAFPIRKPRKRQHSLEYGFPRS
jgi:sigma-54 dependent transcriptional regulator, flagellar regulatory protein